MPYEVTADEQAAIVRVRVWGLASDEDHRAARREAAQMCNSRVWPRMLVDLRDLQLTDTVTAARCFRFGSTYHEQGISRDCRLATLLPRAAEARRENVFYDPKNLS